MRANLLFIVPTMPSESGNGLAMRAGLILDALARRHAVHLFLVPVAGGPTEPSDFVRQRTARFEVLDLAANLDPYFGLISRVRDPAERRRAELAYPKPYLSRFCTSASARHVAEWMTGAGGPLAAVHVMRLYLAPLADALLENGAGLRILDLDDDEIETRQRLARIYRHNGDEPAAAASEAEARKYRALAERYLPAFDRVLVCSHGDEARLQAEFPGARFSVVPNGYPPRRVPMPHATNEATLRLLFVASFGYYPNEDAALFLVREILPALRRLSGRPVQVDLVGGGAAPAVSALAEDPAIRLHGFVPDLGPFYAAADVAVVPVRAAGGTRIKILEAFAHGTPVVSTRIGAEGIDGGDGVHLLLADDSKAFARACILLKEDRARADALVGRAAALLAARYAPERIHAAVAEAYRSMQARPG